MGRVLQKVPSIMCKMHTQIILHMLKISSWAQGYKTFFMLNSAEYEIFSANKYENANNSWHFHIY